MKRKPGKKPKQKINRPLLKNILLFVEDDKNIKINFNGKNFILQQFLPEINSDFVEWSKPKTILDANKAKKHNQSFFLCKN